MSLLRKSCNGATIDELCGLFGHSRQAYYKRGDEPDYRYAALEPLIVESVREYRGRSPRLGAHKLYHLVRRRFEQTGCFPGRDSFIEILRGNNLMVKYKKRRHYKTTDSQHPYKKYPNLIQGMQVVRPNMVWVSDITYVETRAGVCYLSLVTDAYSRKIVGWSLGQTLEAIYPIDALKMALADVPWNSETELIHHSDRGSQYCSGAYVQLLTSHGVGISMTQSGDPLENAIAERANGILKTEWLNHMELTDFEHCKSQLHDIIDFYNNERPHMSLGYMTPSKVHGGDKPKPRLWKNYWQRAAAQQENS